MALLSLKSWTDLPEELRLNKSPSYSIQLLKLVYITQSVTYFNDFSFISVLRMNELMNNIILSNITRWICILIPVYGQGLQMELAETSFL